MNRHVDSYLAEAAQDTEYGKILRAAASRIIKLERDHRTRKFSIDQEVKTEINKVVEAKLKGAE